MKVFLTGATGYIGSVVAEKLLAAGHYVIGLARTEAAASLLQQRGIEPLLGDLHNADALRSGAQTADGVIHTAFIHDFRDFANAVQVERNAIARFVAALAGSGKPLIATSGTGVLGDTGKHIVDEDVPATVTDRAIAEQDILNAAQHGIRSVVLRLPIFVYGRGGSVFPPMLINQAKENGVARYADSGENKFSAVHVEDVAQAYVLALSKAPSASIFHVASEHGVTALAIAVAIGRLLNCPTESIPMEKSAELMGEMVAWIMSINNQTDATKAIKQLGWKPQATSFLEDLERGSYRVVNRGADIIAIDATKKAKQITTICGGDLKGFINTLRQSSGRDIRLVGGAKGNGIPLIVNDLSLETALELKDVRTYDSGLLQVSYDLKIKPTDIV